MGGLRDFWGGGDGFVGEGWGVDSWGWDDGWGVGFMNVLGVVKVMVVGILLLYYIVLFIDFVNIYC